MAYNILDTTGWIALEDEPMGTKRKIWLLNERGQRGLFKYVRVNYGVPTGEDWAEKIASELARLMNIPAAKVELAKRNGERGIVSFDFTREYKNPENPELIRLGSLIHGNELLMIWTNSLYPGSQTYRASEHTIERVMNLLEHGRFLPPLNSEYLPNAFSAADVFVGYLLLDAWIGNTDRHHENWGIIAPVDDSSLRLSPTYDHASSMGRNMGESELADRLVARNRNRTVAGYVNRARSALYENPDCTKPLSPINAFRIAAAHRPEAGHFWSHNLSMINRSDWQNVIEQIPDSLMSTLAMEFVDKMLQETYNRILSGASSTP